MKTIPVLIVGAGPVGMALAAELARHGVACILAEQTDGTIDHPRASAFNARSMEFCRRWGLADKVREVGTPPDFPHDSIYCTSLTGHLIARIERPGHGGGASPLPFTPERPQRCNQLWFNPVMRDYVAGLDTVDFRMRCRAEDFSEDADGVTVTLADLDAGTSEQIRADYVVACCGGRSEIAKALGVHLDDSTVLSHSINIFFRVPEMWTLHNKGKAALNFFIGPDGMWGGMTAQDGREHWRLTLHGTKHYVDPSEIDAEAYLTRLFGGDFPHELINLVAWARREWVHDCFRKGRLIAAGDSAHQNSPTGGFGMNTGLGDADNLGWKLAAMVQGWGGDTLLASYEPERRPVALRNVGEAAENFRRYTLPDTTDVLDEGAKGTALRERLGREIQESQARMILTDGIALGYRYEGSPIVAPDGTAEPPDPPSAYTPTARPGHRAPHGWLADGRSIIDLFGTSFVLLRLGGRAPSTNGIEAAAKAHGVPLDIYSLTEPALCDLYEKPLVLVRPDGHVAWRGDAEPDDAAALIDRVRGA
jgi:2-polyprenyl-6-methoxyphenol hydroxylase-like FAD-dependent oxidoreductase